MTAQNSRTQAGVAYYDRLHRQRRWQGIRAPLETLFVGGAVFALLLLLIDGGRVLLTQQAIDNAAYEAARSLIVPGAEINDGYRTARILSATAGIPAPDIQITPENLTETAGFVSVRISVPYSQTSWCLGRLWKRDEALHAQTTLLTERFAPLQFLALQAAEQE